MTCIPDSLRFGVRMEHQIMAKKKKMRLCANVQKTFEEGEREFIRVFVLTRPNLPIPNGMHEWWCVRPVAQLLGTP